MDGCEQSFQDLKTALITAPVLALPDFQRDFILSTDSSTVGISYILSQRDDQGRERVISYGGRGLRPNEAKWEISEIEGLAVVEGVKAYHVYLAGRPFEIVTDHISLTYIDKFKLSGNNRLTRWALFLQGYQYTINYKKGVLLTSADALSRKPRDHVTREPVEAVASVGALSKKISLDFGPLLP